MDKMIPIHMLDEGYKTIKPVFLDAPDGLAAEGYIDKKYDWIARVKITSRCEEALEKRVDVQFAVFAEGILDGNRETSDIIARGVLEIIPGPYVPVDD